jgi:PAS domain S-box-containing protein
MCSIFEALPDPVFVKNSQHIWVYGNAAFARLLGRDDFVGKGDDIVFPPEQVEIFHAHDRRVFAGESTLNEEQVGENLYALTKKSPIRLPDGSIGLVAMLFDITIYKENERRAHEATAESSAKSRFLANMSHEIRTPLNGMLGMAQSLGQDDLSPAQKAKIDIMLDSGRTLLTVVNDILDLSKIAAGKMEISPVEEDISRALRGTIDLFRPRAEEKGLTINLVLDTDLPKSLKFDPARVRQCMSNLVSNAIKFTDKGGVDVIARAKPAEMGKRRVEIEVRDSGVGMTADQVSRLFAEFTQVDDSSTRRFGGTGLGLAIARRLARLMGGDITVNSIPGSGSAFLLSLPMEDAAPLCHELPSSDRKPTSLQRGRRVLIVDDNPINRRVVRLFVAPFGFEVAEAGDGREALDKLTHDSFDLVLMDVHMPVMDGAEAVQRIRASDASWARVPVIMVTADAMNGSRQRYLALGADGYVTKPIDQRELFAAIASVLESRPEAAGVAA